MIARVLWLAVTLALAACAPSPPLDRAAEHPLAGRIWSTEAQTFVSHDELLDAMADARFVLLGEAHDNSTHHRLQAWAVRALAERNRHLALVAEMIAADQEPGLALFYETPRSDADHLAAFLDWENSGWPAFAMYKPIFDAALRAGFPVDGGNLDRRHIPAMHEKGWAALPADARARLDLGTQLPDTVAAPLRDAIAEAHCGMLDAAQIEPFAQIQYARDAHMARALMDSAGEDGAVLIAGAEHVRRDVGVPYHLARLQAKGEILSLAFVEAAPGLTEPAAYDLPYDYVWFTDGPARADPCAGLLP